MDTANTRDDPVSQQVVATNVHLFTLSLFRWKSVYRPARHSFPSSTQSTTTASSFRIEDIIGEPNVYECKSCRRQFRQESDRKRHATLVHDTYEAEVAESRSSPYRKYIGGAKEDIAQIIEIVPQADKNGRLFQLLKANPSETIVVASPAPLDLFLFAFVESERCLILVVTKQSADEIGAFLSERAAEELDDARRSNAETMVRSAATVHRWYTLVDVLIARSWKLAIF